MEYNVISADNHILEPPDTFVERLPAKFKDKAPRVVRGQDGGDGWSVNGAVPTSTVAMPGGLGVINPDVFSQQDYRTKGRGLTWEEVRPGSYEGAAHVKDMQADGVDAAVGYLQTSGRIYYALVDANPDLALACLQAANDWLVDDFCAADPKRLVGLCLLPTEHDLDSLQAETQRMLAKGAKGFHLPYSNPRPYHEDYYDSIWQAISDAGAVASIHRTDGGRRPAASAAGVGSQDAKKTRWLSVAGTVQRWFSGIPPLTEMVFTGLFERFPRLKMVDAEVNMGWLPWWTATMDQEYRKHSYWSELPMTAPPHTCIGKNIFVTALNDELGFEYAKTDPLLASAAMFSLDYPHEVTLWGKTQQHITQLTAGMDAETKHNILAGNAARVFGLD